MRQQIFRLIRYACFLAVAVNAAAFTYAYVLHPEFVSHGFEHPSVAWFAFMVRTMTFHAGLYLLVVVGVCLCVRAIRTGWAALLLAVVLLAPTLWDARPKSNQIQGPTLTIASFNLWSRNTEYDAVIRAILDTNADVVCLQEYTPEWHEHATTALAPRYPHSITDPQTGFYGSAIFSRYRFVTGGKGLSFPRSRPSTYTFGKIERDDTQVLFMNLHFRHQGDAQTIELREVTGLIKQLKSSCVVIGDFNFTQYSVEHASLLETGYRDALDIAGSGLKTTWPNNRLAALAFYPGFRIDHAYLSPDLTAKTARVAPTPGSDHAHLVIEVGFTP